MQRQLEQQKRTKSPYDTLRRVYERYSTSALLENKAAVARDHLGNMQIKQTQGVYVYIYIYIQCGFISVIHIYLYVSFFYTE